MKHSYSIPNNSKEDRLYHARNTLKSHKIITNDGGSETILSFLMRMNRRGMFTLQAFTCTADSRLRTVYQICHREIDREIFDAARIVIENLGYQGVTRELTWGYVTEWVRDGWHGVSYRTVAKG